MWLDQTSKALECLQKRTLNIIFPGSEYMTNLIIANVETLSHDDGYILLQLFFRRSSVGGGGMAPCPPLDPPLLQGRLNLGGMTHFAS